MYIILNYINNFRCQCGMFIEYVDREANNTIYPIGPAHWLINADVDTCTETAYERCQHDCADYAVLFGLTVDIYDEREPVT